jgi:hypothetical protein
MWKITVLSRIMYGIRVTDGSTYCCDFKEKVYQDDLRGFDNAWQPGGAGNRIG